MQSGFPGMNQNEDASMEGIGNALGGLLKGLTDELGGDGQNEQFTQKFTDMFKNLNQNNIEEAASNLLNEFMDKNLLLEPLQ